jgi:hypothetical protein
MLWKKASLSAVLGAALIVAAGCKKAEAPAPAPAATPAPAPAAAAVNVADIALGSAINADKTVTAASTTFKPADTIYAAVKTDGTSTGATLAAKWTFQDGQTVHQESITIAPTGPAVSEFHISKPDGWPAGKYKLEISLNGNPAGSRDFEVH